MGTESGVGWYSVVALELRPPELYAVGKWFPDAFHNWGQTFVCARHAVLATEGTAAAETLTSALGRGATLGRFLFLAPAGRDLPVAGERAVRNENWLVPLATIAESWLVGLAILNIRDSSGSYFTSWVTLTVVPFATAR